MNLMIRIEITLLRKQNSYHPFSIDQLKRRKKQRKQRYDWRIAINLVFERFKRHFCDQFPTMILMHSLSFECTCPSSSNVLSFITSFSPLVFLFMTMIIIVIIIMFRSSESCSFQYYIPGVINALMCVIGFFISFARSSWGIFFISHVHINIFSFFIFIVHRGSWMVVKSLCHKVKGKNVPWSGCFLNLCPLVLEPDLNLRFVQFQVSS